MSVTVKLRSVRHSARKILPVTRMFVGKPLEFALHQTAVMSQDSAKYLYKALKMAEAAAKQKEFDVASLVVSQAFATQGARIRRVRANARGRGNSYQKHLAHITVILTPAEKTEPVAEKSSKKNTEKTTSRKSA